MKKLTHHFLMGSLLVGAATCSTITLASDHEVTANIGVLSGYYLRGLTNAPESENPVVQGGIDYSHASGFYAGWWGSTLDYSLTDYNVLTDEFEGRKAFEHDFYAGYNGSFNEDFGYTIGAAYYYYYESDAEADADGFETILGLNYKNVSFTAQTLLDNLDWGNRGDTYLNVSYSHDLPKDFTFNSSLGAYYYSKNSKNLATPDNFGFRHFNIGLSKPLGDTGLTASMDYILGGYDRYDDKQKNKVVFGLGYSF